MKRINEWKRRIKSKLSLESELDIDKNLLNIEREINKQKYSQIDRYLFVT